MATRPFAPLNVDLFPPTFYPSAVARMPAPGPERSEQEVRQLLDAYAAADPDLAVEAAMAVFDDPVAKAKIPSPTLRAALGALEGTIGSPAIEFILRGTFSGGPAVLSVEFSAQLFNSGNIAEVHVRNDTGQLLIRVNDRFVAENPFLLTSSMAHEAGHQDSHLNHHEEIALDAFDSLLYLRQLQSHPELAAEPTLLAQMLNVEALARLNSGLGAQLGLSASNGGLPVLPGSVFTNESFRSLFAPFGPASTPGNAILESYLQALATNGSSACSATAFDSSLIDCMSGTNAGFTPEEGVAAARVLDLEIES